MFLLKAYGSFAACILLLSALAKQGLISWQDKGLRSVLRPRNEHPYCNHHSCKFTLGSFSGEDKTAIYSRTAMCYACVTAESHRYAPQFHFLFVALWSHTPKLWLHSRLFLSCVIPPQLVYPALYFTWNLKKKRHFVSPTKAGLLQLNVMHCKKL